MVAARSMAVRVGTRATVGMTGLAANTMYDAYIVVESSSGFGTVMKIDVPSALARPNLANASVASLVAGSRATITFTNSGGGALTRCAVSPTLPTGLGVSRTAGNASCQITGTPSVARGRTTYRVTATNATGTDATPATVAITVAAAPVVLARPNLANASAASVTVGTRASAILFTNSGGGALTRCAISPTLPTGLGVSRTAGNASCQITGTPRVARGRTTYRVTATNATGMDTTPATVAITVAAAPPSLARPNLANVSAASTLTAGTRASPILFTNNGGGALTRCAVSPTLPTGLGVSRTAGNASCQITGIPTAVSAEGTYRVTATNATGADITPASVSITVALARPNLANASAASLTAGTRATAIIFTNSGGGALTGCAVSPTLPTGLGVSRTTGNASCQITGTPSAASSGTYTVTATNATGADSTPATVAITVALARPNLANATAASLVAGSRATITFTNSGSGALTGCAVNPPLPTGLGVSRTTGNASCQITGTPSAASSGNYTVTATNATGADTTPATVSITVTVSSGGSDADGDGLIEISTLAQLNNVRYSLDGAGYKISASATAVTTGCPTTGCIGYELVNDLTFDRDGDGSTWTRKSDGSVTLDADDNNDDYFDIASDGSSGGWVPIGDCGADAQCFFGHAADNAPFTAVFEGNGHTITGLATMRDLTHIGLFGFTSDAEIRNIGLVGNLARYTRRY